MNYFIIKEIRTLGWMGWIKRLIKDSLIVFSGALIPTPPPSPTPNDDSVFAREIYNHFLPGI